MSLTKFTSITGACVPVPGPDMDTDRIIPSRFLKCITFDELANVMFWDERFDENGKSKSHPVDDPRFRGASIILGGANFGCGSSREHAPQTIRRSGIKAVIAESFAEIFFGNSTGIGLPCVCASAGRLHSHPHACGSPRSPDPGPLGLHCGTARQPGRRGKEKCGTPPGFGLLLIQLPPPPPIPI